MSRLDRYMLARLLRLFGLSALVLILVYWINRAIGLFDQIIADGEGFGVFLELTLLALPPLVAIAAPISAVVAAIYVTNRLTADSELVVAQAVGLSPWRLARPVLVFGLIVAALLSVLTHLLIPTAAARLADRQDEIARTATARILRPGAFLDPADGITLYIREISATGEVQDLFLSDSTDPDETVTFLASRAFLVRTEAGPQLVMVNGQVQVWRRAEDTLSVTEFDEFAYDIGALMPAGGDTARRAREVGTAELLAATPALQQETGENAGALVVEGHERFADAALGAVGAMIGFSALMVGGFSRLGVWRQIGLAVGLVILVKLVESGTTSAVRGDPALWPLLYLPTALGAGLSAALLAVAGRTRRAPPIGRRADARSGATA
ncbi:LPS export ABC transporter permease LptF [Wenxinia saemankumensis]|uniref:Lipopolysaccharide export system permease protein n=1 Tax=Wenxinia saemankumensis TaxID=1447782 RepID=A0A1M6HH70_9RHOB|nr:LPS export ABC transporter permease LptF [Wenxinia saemankumensis]SHJ21538.1 lipopolysaccharide export system permease protein [Wenxinia saemankumensis]